jgi:hypothetical protein
VIEYVCANQQAGHILAALFIVDKALEYWLGKTDKVQASSMVGLVFNIIRRVLWKSQKG